jgi:signal transduction histidine kinase
MHKFAATVSFTYSLLFFLLLISAAQAQQPSPITVGMRLNAYAEQASLYLSQQQPDSAWQMALKPGMPLVRLLPATSLPVRKFRYTLSSYYYKTNDSKQAIWLLKQLMATQSEADTGHLDDKIRYALTQIYSDHGEYQACIAQTFDNLRKFIPKHDYASIASAYTMLAWVYEQQQDTLLMNKYTQLGIQFSRQSGTPSLMLLADLNEAEVQKRNRQYNKAIILYRRVLNQYESQPIMRRHVPKTYNDLAASYLKIDRLAEAEAAAKAGLQHTSRIKNMGSEAELYTTLSAIYERQEKFQASLVTVRKALPLALRTGYAIVRRQALEQLTKALERTGKPAEALRAARQLAALTDSLSRINKAEAIAAAEARFGVQQKNATIGLLNKNLALRQQQARQEKQIAWLVIALLSIGVGTIGVSWYRVRQTGRLLRQQNTEIERQATQLANLNQFKDQLFSIISHDLRGPVISLQRHIDQLRNVPDEAMPDTLARLGRSANTLTSLTDNLLCWALAQMGGLRTRPQPFSLYDSLTDVLALYAEPIRQKQVQVQMLVAASLVTATDTPIDLSDEATVVADENQTDIVLRNVIQNAIRFSPQKGTLTFQTQQTDGQLTLLIADDGPGFDWEPNPAEQTTNPTRPSQTSTGLGLTVVEELMRHNGGTLSVARRADAPGTLVRLSWPIYGAVTRS